MSDGQGVFGGAFPRGENRNIDVAQRRHSILSVRRDHILSGHSKWHNIQKTKGAADAKRSAAFTKIAKEIIVAVKQGGSGDPNNNSRLATVIAKAKAANMPNDNIKRTIDKALGSGNTDNYESVTYEGYGPGGVAVIVEALTDNRQRTAPEVRHYFDKYGKGMGAQGCVSWSFDRKGVIIIDNEDGDYDEDAVMMDALEAGADDFNAEDNVFEITTDPDAFNDVVKALEEKNYAFVSADISLVPQTYVKLESDEDLKNMAKLLDMLDDNDDVQNTDHNWDQASTPCKC
ncbi:YebC/PmpR family DNA-binding transcriptional regulator [Alistipes communis]|uniref:YebC/PmpR family DNA-binding transcriptional regulator n=1 Tax=Alistipes communis TaxID=2585118 RepID=UPI003AEF650E